MAESMNLDSSDLVGSLDGFENLEQMSEFGISSRKEMLGQDDDEAMDMMEVRDDEPPIKEEIIEDPMDQADVHPSENLFSGEVIEEVVGGGGEDEEEEESKMYEEMDTLEQLVEEVVEETVITDDDPHQSPAAGVVSSTATPVATASPASTRVVTPGVYVVATSNSNIVSAAHTFLPKGSVGGGTRLVMSPVDGSTGQTIRLVAANQADDRSPGQTSSGQTIRIVSSGSVAQQGDQSPAGQTIRIVSSGGVAQSGDQSPSGQTIRIVSSSGGQTKTVKTAPRTITLAEARQMGLITSAKINTILPTAILPKPNTSGTLKGGSLVSGGGSQVIRIPAGQALNNLHQLQLPGKQVQYVKLVGTGGKVSGQVGESGSSSSGKQVPVAFTGSLLSPHHQTFKLVSIATTPGGSQRVLIPAGSQPVVSSSQSSSGSQSGNATSNLVVLPTHVIQAATAASSTATTSVSNTSASASSALSSASNTASSPQPTATSPIPHSDLSPTSNKESVEGKSSSPESQTGSTGGVKVSSGSLKKTGSLSTSPVLSASAQPTPIKTKEVIVPAGGGTGSLSLSTGGSGGESTPPIVIKTEPDLKTVIKEPWSPSEESLPPSQPQTFEPNGIRPRKPCNCTKSMCLKLYCDCFANGEFCHQCNCTCCYNNLEHEEERQRAIKLCLERNPTAFRPKIGKSYLGSEERRHNKGCNCRRSGCLKNYCECYEAKIPCSKNCKCVGCKNVDSPFVLRREDDPRVMSGGSGGGVTSGGTLLRLIKAERESARSQPSPAYLSSIKQAYRMMSNEVVEATCQCLLAQAEDWEKEQGVNSEPTNNSSLDVAQSLILEEFSRCIVQIVDCVTKSTAGLHNFT